MVEQLIDGSCKRDKRSSVQHGVAAPAWRDPRSWACEQPVLIIHGEDDVRFCYHALALAEALREAEMTMEVHMLPKTTHYLHSFN